MKIKQIDISSRPREKIIERGAKELSDIELLAIMLSSGTKEESVLDLSARLISEYGFDRLFKMSYSELNKIKGIKKAKATKLMASFEIARRASKIINNNPKLLFSNDVYEYLKNDYLLIDTEVLIVIYVDKNCIPIKKCSYTNDGVADCIVPIRKIVNEAINLNAFGIFLAHNHPSGDITPSPNDIDATRRLMNILKPLSIMFFDHIIIGNNKYFSISDSNILFNKKLA